MAAPRSLSLVEIVLRCYPAPWRSRHGDEAAELAALLIRDGVPARSIAWSYLRGAARERIPRPGRRRAAVAAALMAATGSLAVPFGLLSAPAPASAASATRAHSTSHPAPAARVKSQLQCGASISIRATKSRPADPTLADGHGRRC